MTDDPALIWHSEVMPAATDAALRAVRDAGLADRFYLAGGTGLALQLGHRLSLDLDFFSPDHFDEDALLQIAQRIDGFTAVSKAPFTVHAVVGRTKVSFLGYAYPLLFAMHPFNGVEIADPREIACMKLSAVAGRGAISSICMSALSGSASKRF